jgi:tRNA-Thr(GGU) m(6)t(6)A37 methyltransferase TsaA
MPHATAVQGSSDSCLYPELRDQALAEAVGGRTPVTGADRDSFVVRPIGRVESPLVERDQAPLQGDEGSPDVWLAFEPEVSRGLADLQVGSEVILLTWLHRARRDVLAVHPRDDQTRPLTGVFSTRSPDRPNPIGLHRVRIVAIDGLRVRVQNLEALNGTPVLDVKPVLEHRAERQARSRVDVEPGGI